MKLYIQKQQFNPGLLGIFINPFFLVRRELWLAMVHFAQEIRGSVLDVGCGHRPYEEIFSHAEKYTGLEFDSLSNRSRFKKIDAWYDGLHFPFPDNSFDSVIVTQVLEHVFNPDTFLSELFRILKKDGRVLLTVPFVWDEHEQPHDYARYSSFGLAHVLTTHGFVIVQNKKTCNDVRIIFQLINCYIHKRLAWVKSYSIKIVFFAILTAPFTLAGIIFGTILPKNNDLYADNVVLAIKS